MRFDLTDLRLFAHVHEAGTITGGAARSHMTLASASERIRGMERALGVPLLLRDKRGVRPTDAGRTLLHHARVVLSQLERMNGELREYGSGLKGHVRLMCNTAAMSEYLPQALAGFLAANPRISVDLEERASAHIADAVRHGLCDLGLVSDAADLQGLQVFLLRPDPLVLVVPRNHALRERRALALSEVLAVAADSEFIGLADTSALQEHVTQHARLLGRTLAYRIRLRSFEAICQMVGAGIGMAVIPRTAARRHGRAAGVRTLALSDRWAQRKLALCMRELDALPAHGRQLVQQLLAHHRTVS